MIKNIEKAQVLTLKEQVAGDRQRLLRRPL